MSLLDVSKLSFSVGESNILNDISFTINKGEMVGLIGPNGSGKTSLFNCISGFNLASSGNVFLHDNDITKLSSYDRARHGIGRVFQNFGIFREMTVIENLITAIESRQGSIKNLFPWGKQHKSNLDLAYTYLEKVNLQQKAKTKASSLSGGQMRLLEIVRTLAFGAELFLLDEPTAGVSPKMKDDVANIICTLKSLDKTVLTIEHDISFIQKFCTRILVLNVGKLVLDGTPDEVRENALLQEIYFGNEKTSNY